MNEFTQHYDITGDASSFIRAVDASAASSQKFGTIADKASKQTITFNTALNRFQDASGRIVSNLEALNSIGAATESQSKDLLKIYDALAKRYEKDQVALAGITSARASLAKSIGLETSAARALKDEREKTLTLEERLNAVGIQTGAQIENRIELLRSLFREARNDTRAQQQLAVAIAEQEEQVRRLDEANRRNAQSTKLSQFTLLNFGFAVQDASTFSQGFAFGLRSIANNLDGVFRSFGELKRQEGGFSKAFKRLGQDITSPGGLIVALNLVTTASVVLFDLFDKRGRELDKIAEKAKNLTNELIKLRSSTEGITFAPDVPDLEEAVKVGERLLEITNQRIAAIERQKAAQTTATGFGVPSASLAAPIDQEELEKLQDRSTRLTTTLENQREILADQKALEETRNILREQGLDVDTRLEASLQQATDELREQEQIRAAMTRIQGRSLATGQQLVSTVQRETELIKEANELRELAAKIDERRRTFGVEIAGAATRGALQEQNRLLDEQVGITERIARTGVRQGAGARAIEASVAARQGRLDAINGILDEQVGLLKEAARLTEIEARASERIEIIRKTVANDIRSATIDARDRQTELLELRNQTNAGARDEAFNIDAQNAYLERQLALSEAIRAAKQKIREIDKVDTLGLQNITDLSQEAQRALREPLDIILGGSSDLIKSLQLDELPDAARVTADAIVESLKQIPYELDQATQEAYDASIDGAEDYSNRFLTIIKLMLKGHNEEFAKATEAQRAFFGELSGLAGEFTGIASDNLRVAEEQYKLSIERQKDIAKAQVLGFTQISAAATEASKENARKALVAYKRVAVTEAIINAYLAGSQVWASKLPLAAKVVATGAVIAQGFRIVNQIRRTTIDSGGGGAGVGGFGVNPQKDRWEFLKDGLQARNPAPGSIVPVTGAANNSLLPALLSSVLPGYDAPTVDLAVTITPKAISSGDIVFSVESGLANRKSRGLRSTIKVPI